MSVKLEDRPISSLRDEVIDVLIHNYSHGVITESAFERRLDIVMTSKEHGQIVAQIADLEAPSNDEIKDLKRKQFEVQYDATAEAESAYSVNIFGGSDRKGHWIVPPQLYTISIFGGGNIDMTHATFTSETVRVKSLCFCGGENIYVPPGTQVVTSAICLFGGVDSKMEYIPDHKGPTVIVEGFVLFGGITVKAKSNFKKMFMSFANQMKALLNN